MLHTTYQRLLAARRNESGFTLIELLIVIVILGVLAGTVVFSVKFIQSRGENAACKTDRRNVEVAVEAYYAQEGAYPADQDALVTAGVLKEKPNSNKYTITYDAG